MMNQPNVPPSTELVPSAEMLAKTGLVRSPFGYYEMAVKPNEAELEKYYRDNYYQKEKGSYLFNYDEEELAFTRGQILLRYQLITSRGWLPQGQPLSMLDVGCGEGHSLSFYAERGWKVHGLDFSTHGVEKMNPHCLPWLTQGDVFGNLDKLIEAGVTYDLVMLDNVLEHVVDPVLLLRNLHRLAKPGSILVIDVPNDFSALQLTAIEKEWIDRPFWVATPEHISYFSGPSLRNVCAETGWAYGAMMADFPIDWFLSNPNSNYVMPGASGTGKGTNLGKGAHRARIAMENLMRETNLEGLITMYQGLAATGMGRSLVGFFLKS